jgi:hypothetical protein
VLIHREVVMTRGVGRPKGTTNEVSDERLRQYLRRFGPCTTTQIAQALAIPQGVLVARLRTTDNIRQRGHNGRTLIWEYAPTDPIEL